jgi:hypothetical protein
MAIYFKSSSSVHYIILYVIGTSKPFSSLSLYQGLLLNYVPSGLSAV